MSSKKWLGGLAAAVVAAVVLVLVMQRQGPQTVGDPMVIGVLTDLTSYTAEYGQQERAGLEVLAADINAGKLPKVTRKIELDVQDTKIAPKEAVTALNQMFTRRIPPSLIFSAASSVSMAILPLTQQKNMLVLSNATSPNVLQASSLSIRNFPDPTQEVDLLFSSAIKPLGIKSLGVMFINDEYGKSMKDLVTKEAANSSPLKLSYSEAFGFDVSDFKPLISKLQDAGADAVLCVGYPIPYTGS